MNVVYKWFMFWAVDMVVDENTMWTREKENIAFYERRYRTLLGGGSVWFIEADPDGENHWRFLHELCHMKVQAKGLTRKQWIWNYIKRFWFYESEADDFANEFLNARPCEVKDVVFR